MRKMLSLFLSALFTCVFIGCNNIPPRETNGVGGATSTTDVVDSSISTSSIAPTPIKTPYVRPSYTEQHLLQYRIFYGRWKVTEILYQSTASWLPEVSEEAIQRYNDMIIGKEFAYDSGHIELDGTVYSYETNGQDWFMYKDFLLPMPPALNPEISFPQGGAPANIELFPLIEERFGSSFSSGTSYYFVNIYLDIYSEDQYRGTNILVIDDNHILLHYYIKDEYYCVAVAERIAYIDNHLSYYSGNEG